jgi:hypothetical protein
VPACKNVTEKNIFVITPDQNDSDSLVQNVTRVTMELPLSIISTIFVIDISAKAFRSMPSNRKLTGVYFFSVLVATQLGSVTKS